jgi:SET domain-containing protein
MNIFQKYRKIIVNDSEIHGRGVFSTDQINENDLIERCPIVPLDFPSKYHCDLKLLDYVYAKHCKPCDTCNNHGHYLYMVLGYGMVYNHQDNANAMISFDYKNLTADITAIKDIEANQEIYISYGPMYFLNKKKIEL